MSAIPAAYSGVGLPAVRQTGDLVGDGRPERGGQIISHTPMARFGESKELIGAAIFLASHKASSFVTGTDIRVDGGFLSQTI